MKQYILKFSLLGLVTILSFGCNDEFLQRDPLDAISNDSFWNSENDMIVYNNSIYDIARREDDVCILVGHDEGFDSQSRGTIYWDGFSDNTAPRHSRADFFAKKRAGKHSVPTSPEFFGYKGWNFLSAVNFGLDNYDRVPVEQEVKNKYIAEARLLRAMFYADKVNKFGDVKWIDKPITHLDDDILNSTRDSRTLVMDKVLEDLNFATAGHIPEDVNYGGTPGRLNHWAALAIKARICLFEGTWRKYHGLGGETAWLQAAADAAQELLVDGPYSLYMTGDPSRDYNKLHQMEDYSGVSEVIYWRRYEAGIFTNHALNYYKGYNGGATKNMVEDYLCTDGLPISLSPLYQGDEVYSDIFVDRDPRLRQTILHPADVDVYRYGNHPVGSGTIYPKLQGMGGGLQVYTGYHIIKHWQLEPSYATYNTSTTPAIVFRLGEVMLIYAEAKAELGTITQGDLDMSINLLRDRVNMPHMDLTDIPVDPRYTSDGISPLLVEIRRERRVELFTEGFRYDDLRRWKQGSKLLQKDYGMRWDDANKAALTNAAGSTVGFSNVDGVPYIEVYKGTDYETPEFDENKHYLWPLPLSAISQNPNLGQNPGWGGGE
ncbi:MAG: RagB/SusD family nutrient uptake outer membrane protein [Cyclobacteriaceae bacterium]|nr:RagB/SusD family nutrient uptake outer membrane protein [Cyclobacteriaceae bacterium SS2]